VVDIFFQDRVLRTVCVGLALNHKPPDLCLLPKITGVSHWHLASDFVLFLFWQYWSLLARQVLYHLSHAAILFDLTIFEIRSTFMPRQAWRAFLSK
jgi:hypothetical protein